MTIGGAVLAFLLVAASASARTDGTRIAPGASVAMADDARSLNKTREEAPLREARVLAGMEVEERIAELRSLARKSADEARQEAATRVEEIDARLVQWARRIDFQQRALLFGLGGCIAWMTLIWYRLWRIEERLRATASDRTLRDLEAAPEERHAADAVAEPLELTK